MSATSWQFVSLLHFFLENKGSMIREWTILLGDLTLLCLAASVLIAAVAFKRLSPALRIFSFYLLCNLILEALARVAVYFNTASLAMVHLFTLIEFIILSMFYGRVIREIAWFRRSYHWLVLGGSLFIILNSLFIQPINRLNSYAETLENIILIFYAILFFYNQYQKEESHPNYDRILIWINSGILLYISGSLFIFMFGDVLARLAADQQILLFILNAALNLLFKIIILIALIQVFWLDSPTGKTTDV
ncbi:MAG: hypothetical protein AAFP19_26085 [Bacteroidota bacterium]